MLIVAALVAFIIVFLPGGGTVVVVSTDKDAYHLGDELRISASIYSPRTAEVTVAFSGFDGVPALERTTLLTRGWNVLNFSFELPRCGCELGYGVYFAEVKVLSGDGVVANATCAVAVEPPGSYLNLSPEVAARMLSVCGDALLLDVRTPEEFAEKHIPGAKLIPLSELEGRLRELDREKKLIVYCRSGGRSARACALLSEHGFEAFNLKGGIMAWEASGLPVTSRERK